MSLINEDMKDVVSKTRIFSIATASPDGEPNVVPITFAKLISDDEFLVMDNFMEKTEANLKANPRIAISCWDVNPQTKVTRAYQFKGDIHRYMSRHLVKTGMTGWAQVHGLRQNTSFEDRVKYDLFYMENWSIWFDLKIIAMTFFKKTRSYAQTSE